MLHVDCTKCHEQIKVDDPIAIEYGRVYHFKCQFPQGVDDENFTVGAGVSIHQPANSNEVPSYIAFPHDHLGTGSS